MKPPFSRSDAAADLRPRDASTVILLRDAPGTGLEVLLMQRHAASSFMGGAYVFPGGAVDAADAAPGLLARVDEAEAERFVRRLEATPGRTLARQEALALGMAAIRELFEEAGVLLARRADGGAPTFADGDAAHRFVHHRTALNGGELDLGTLLREEDLVPDLDALCYFAHWLTPSAEARRFDARFFLARLPEGQTPLVDDAEMVAQRWLPPAVALEAAADGALFLPPPTLRNVEDLTSFADLAAALEGAGGRRIEAILPRMAQEGEQLLILLPWDPAYPEAEGEGFPALDPAVAVGPSRIVLERGRWFSRFA